MKKILLAVALAGLTATSCSTVSMTGRKQLNLVSESEVLTSSLASYQSYMQTAKLSTDANRTAIVRNVATRIAQAAEAYLKSSGQEADLQNYSWEINLTQNSELNAFCMPGGKIVVYEGMLNLIGNSATRDDELAAVIGHEVGHAIAKHGQERMSQQMLTNLGSSVLSTVVKNKSQQTQQLAALAYGMGTQYGALLPFSRKHELEADYIGLVLMTMAGYQPEAALTLWEKMDAASTSQPSEFTSTHPSHDRRMSELRKNIPEVRKALGVTAPNTTTKTSTNAKKTTQKSGTGFKIG